MKVDTESMKIRRAKIANPELSDEFIREAIAAKTDDVKAYVRRRKAAKQIIDKGNKLDW